MNKSVPIAGTKAGLNGHAFERVQKIAKAVAGLAIPDSKRTMVQSRLSKRLKPAGFENYDSYLNFVEQSDGASEREKMISALTTNVSHFFREQHHFDLLCQEGLIERAQSGERIRIWSAGCSTGQEPYSIAMTLLGLEPNLGKLDIRILASDIDMTVLAHAVDGKYEMRHVENMQDNLRARYFTADSTSGIKSFQANSDLKRLITFRQLNLMEAWPMKGKFDAVFCRNVVIYFSEETQTTLWPRFASQLNPSALFFLGHSERMQDPNRFGFNPAGVTCYRRAAYN